MQARLVAKAKRKHCTEVDRLTDSYAERDSRSARTQQAAWAAARAEAQTALRALLEQQRQSEGETKDSDQDGHTPITRPPWPSFGLLDKKQHWPPT